MRVGALVLREAAPWVDGYQYAMLAREWRAATSRPDRSALEDSGEGTTLLDRPDWTAALVSPAVKRVAFYPQGRRTTAK